MRQIFQVLFLLSLPLVSAAQKNDTTTTTTVLTDYIVTAQTMPTDIRSAVHAVKIIDRQVIERRAANNLEELLSGEANVRFSSDLILGSGVRMNGVGGENVKIMIDGVPVIGRLDGNIDLSQIPLHNVERVEIIQGSLSAMYGSDASGGVINIITKKSQANTYSGEVNGQAESVGIQTLAAQLGFQKKKLLLQASGNYYHFGGYPVDSLRSSLWNPKEQLSAQATIKYYFSEKQKLNYTYNTLDEQVSNLGDIKRPTFKPYAFDDTYLTRRNDHQVNYEGFFKKMSVQSVFAMNYFYRQKNTYRTDITKNEQLEVAGEQDTSRFHSVLSRSIFGYDFDEKNSLIAGIELYQESAFGKKIKDTTANKANFTQMLDAAVFIGTKQKTLGSKMVLQPMFRYTYNSKYNAPITPSINLLYQFSDNWSLRAGYARGFRAPSLKELYFNFIDINHDITGNQDLKAERAHNFLLTPSVTKQYGSYKIQAEANIFYNDIQSRIVLAQYELLKYQYLNIAEFKTKGAGVNVTFRYKDVLAFKNSFIYTGYYNTARDEKPELPVYLYSPEMTNDLTLTYANFTFNVLHKYTGMIPTYNFGKNAVIEEGRLAAWSMLNASLGKTFWGQKIRITTGAKNLLNITSLTSQGAVSVGHNQSAGEIPVSFGRSFFIKMGIKIN